MIAAMSEAGKLSQKGGALLQQFPGPVTLYQTWFWRGYWIFGGASLLIFGIFILLALFAPSALSVIGLEPRPQNEWDWKGIILTLSLGLSLSAMGIFGLKFSLFGGAVSLSLDIEGFELHHPYNRRKVFWTVSSDFAAVSLTTRDLLTYKDANQPRGGLGSLNQSDRSGFANVFAVQTEDLAALMNAWRARVLAQPSVAV